MSPGRLRALDDRFDRALRRHGSSLMGDHPGAESGRGGRVAPVGAVAVVIVVAVARLVSGQSPWPVIGGSIGFAVGAVLVLRKTSRIGTTSDDTERERAASRGLTLSSLGLFAMALALGLAGIWQGAALLIFFIVFFNGMGWVGRRAGQPPRK